MDTWDSAVEQIAGTIWQEILGLPLQPVVTVADVERKAVAGYVEITGAWNGVVELQCSIPLARRAAGIMFGTEPSQAGDGQVDDALGELANMAGGNLKALMPEPCRLSLPSVARAGEGASRRAGRRVLGRCEFACEGEWVRVTLLENAEGRV